MSFNTKLINLLKTDPRLVDDEGELVLAAVQDRAWKIDHGLVKLLLSDKEIKAKFFDEIEGHWIFNINTFIDYISQKNFLDNSYTRFRNRIGLTIGDKFLRERGEVALAWPYKDCVLEGGQTKEEEKRKEIFFNEVLAQDEINRLLDPKVLTNFTRYTSNGKEKVTDFKRDENGVIRENLIIKGNNLLALHTLKTQFRGKVKLIYIDPPYNTGNDDFKYNDNFNHSAWLTFMKNRLQVANTLLRNDGAIFVNCDDNEQAYLKILMDEEFGAENFVADFIWNHRKSSQNDIDVSLSHNYILCYAKNRSQFRLNPLGINGEKFENPDNDPKGEWTADPMDAQGIRENLMYKIINPNTGKEHYPPAGRHWRFTNDKYEEALAEGRIVFGKTGKSRPQYKRYRFEAEARGTNPFTIWDDVGTATEATKELMKLFETKQVFSTPKPERLLERIIHLATKANDIVLDYFIGSGTTAAVAHKMGRQYIGIEQMDYIEAIPVERLKKVIAGEQGGISKSVNWQGGGDFVYCELMKYNEAFMERIQAARSSEELVQIWREMAEDSFLNWYVNPAMPEEAVRDFEAIGREENGLEKQKHLLAELLDKNQLYVNLTEIDDAQFKVSAEDKALNKAFYGESL
ncbi:MAG: site-specific DNA-methyltransferase [Candidatus Marinimicrobia bacterium]|nr:site-specific DNA-methyltransferase [Candidatus Neomarinimicrobiota bacterium]